jgi:hypothetical protein
MSTVNSRESIVPITTPRSTSSFSSLSLIHLSKPATLLTLPAEVRVLILSHLLIAPHTVRPFPYRSLSSQVLRVCGTLHIEGRLLLYRCNHFDLQVLSTLFTFGCQIGRVNRSLICHLSLPTYLASFYPLRRLTSLRTLRLYKNECINLMFLSDREGMEKRVRRTERQVWCMEAQVRRFKRELGNFACLTKREPKLEVKCQFFWRFTAVTEGKEMKVRVVKFL